MELNEFNYKYVNKLSDNLPKSNKTIFFIWTIQYRLIKIWQPNLNKIILGFSLLQYDFMVPSPPLPVSDHAIKFFRPFFI